jgi:two-component system phosphate regulon sensor histidine kinase PhoR
VKYTPEGGSITIRGALVEGDLRLSVADNGIGIDAQHIPRLTERFYRVDPSRSAETGGTGLGLAIVKHILVRHDGELLIESTLGSGSSFTARLPAGRITQT